MNSFLHLGGIIVCTVALAACKPTPKADTAASTPSEPVTAMFKKGQGVNLPEAMRAGLKLRTAEVAEQDFTPSFTVELHVHRADSIQRATHTAEAAVISQASGWLREPEAALVKPGDAILLEAPGLREAGVVLHVAKAAHSSLGEHELIAGSSTALPIGSWVTATLKGPPAPNATVIPRSAILHTAEGTFVYTANGRWFLRTPVKIGRTSPELVEILDGLYSGDEIVVDPVMPLWLTELHALRGGKGCADGH